YAPIPVWTDTDGGGAGRDGPLHFRQSSLRNRQIPDLLRHPPGRFLLRSSLYPLQCPLPSVPLLLTSLPEDLADRAAARRCPGCPGEGAGTGSPGIPPGPSPGAETETPQDPVRREKQAVLQGRAADER